MANLAKETGLQDYTINDLSSIMINPNEISNVLYATNTYVTQTLGGIKPSAEFSFAKEMLESEKNL